MELLSVQEAARQKGVTRKAIYYAIEHGHLRALKVTGGAQVIRAEDLDAWKPRADAGKKRKPRGKEKGII